MNSVSLIGRLVAKPDLRKTSSGKSVAGVRIAVPRPFAKDKTDFINLVAWERTGEVLAQYGDKGHRIGIQGMLTVREYETNEGQKRSVAEVVVERLDLLEAKGQTKGESQNPVNDDDLPF